MADPTPDPPPAPAARGFPFLTAGAALAILFAFVGLVVWAYNSPNPLGGPKAEPAPDPAAKLAEVKARNRALLDGAGAKMSADAAAAELRARAKADGRLPFPIPEPAAPGAKKN
ncbi:MAG: hypothetical protein C0501_20795 [Isosphaera sp.]|nr:hypothetical protein [Isosphaera sp.]